MRPRPHSSFAALLALSGAAGCNAIFGITPGSEGGTTSTTGGTGGITGGTGGTGGVTGGTGGVTGGTGGVTGGTGGATGGTGGMAGGTGGATGGTGGSCSGSGGPPATGKAYLQRTSAADGGEVGRAMRFDADGNLFLTGTFTTDQVNFGGGKLAYSNPMSYPYEEVFVLKSDPAGDHLASVSWSVTGSARSHGLAVDPANGEVIVVGEFTGDMQIGNTLLQSFELAYTDMFIARLAPDLTPIWAKKFGAIYRQEPEDIAIDSQGNIVVVGATFHPVDFGGGSIGNDNWNTFVVKLSPAGDFVWNQSYATWEPVVKENEDNYYNLAVAIAPNDDVLVGTNFNNQVFFGGSQTFPKGGMDAVVVRLAAADKTFVWKRVIDGGGDVSSDRDQWITSLAVDACGDVYVAGGFRGQLTNGAGAPTLVKGPDPTIADAFLMKLDDAGKVTWQKVFGDAGWQEPTAVRTDSFGNVALAGYMNDGAGYTGVDFGGSIGVLGPNIPDPSPNYSNDAFVVLLDPDGTGLWGRRLGDGEYQAIRSAAFDKKGQLAVTGVFSGAMVLDASQTTLFGVGYDAFVGWYDKAN